MSKYVEVGAVRISDRTDFSSKKALKEEIAANPTNVEFYTVSMFNASFRGDVTKADKAVIWQVTGPNVHTNRKWYASVTIGQNGKITVK